MKHPPGQLKLYSIIIPARDEEESLPQTLRDIHSTLKAAEIKHEIVVVDDGSSDATWRVLQELKNNEIATLAPVQNREAHGFGNAIKYGIGKAKGDAIVIMMADASDSPSDAVKYWRLLNDEGYECAFGSRFIKGGKVIDYPRIKLFVNRLANFLVKVGFAIPLNDTTNAFKAYRRNVIEGCSPILSPHFNITVELPLKSIVRGYSYEIIPISWKNRKYGMPKLKIKEMGSRYFFICAYIWFEKYFSRGDFKRIRS